MKVTVILEKEARICAHLPAGDAAEAFEKMADILIDKLDKRMNKGQPLAEIVKQAETEKVPEESHTEVKMYSRRLVIMKCSGCGAINPCVLQEGQETITCRHCQQETPIEGLVPANYTCPNCNYKASFYALGELKSVRCRSCKSDIDMIFNEKKNCYLSANLIK